uniref:HRDC domain-containing protein n=1 Tax=Piliocolobus tephrosceles TaxID=591936 RepID=A0A8C9G8E7_9PRIM
MEHCSKKIEELVKKKVDLVAEGGENNGDQTLIVKLLSNVIDLVKLSSKYQFNSMYKMDEFISANEIEVNDISNDLLLMVYDLLMYSCNYESRKNIQNICNNDYTALKNNYDTVSTALNELISISQEHYKCFQLTDKKGESILKSETTTVKNNEESMCLINTNHSLNENNKEIKKRKIPDDDDNNDHINNYEQKKKKKSNSKSKSNHNKDNIDEKYNIDNKDNVTENDTNRKVGNNLNKKETNEIYNILFKNKILKIDNRDLEDVQKEGQGKNSRTKKRNKNFANNAIEKESYDADAQNVTNNNTIDSSNEPNKIQNTWMYLINNYANFFIPRIVQKYNMKVPLDIELTQAMEYQEKFITRKKKLLHYKHLYICNNLNHVSCIDIINDTFNTDVVENDSNIQNEEKKKMDTAVGHNDMDDITLNVVSSSDNLKKTYSTTHNEIEKKQECMFKNNMDNVSLEFTLNELYDIDVSDYLYRKMDLQFFDKLLKKLNISFNKCKYASMDLPHPYKHEIYFIVTSYNNLSKNILKFVELKTELVKPSVVINAKEYKLINNKNGIVETIELIKNNCDKISLMVILNYKNTYYPFTFFVLIGTEHINFIIDATNVFEWMYLLNEITTNPNILKITHKCEQAILYLQKDFSIYFVNLIDISICFEYLYSKKSLTYIIRNYFNTTVNSNDCDINMYERMNPCSVELIEEIKDSFHYLYFLFDYVISDLYYNYVYYVNTSAKNETTTNNSDDTVTIRNNNEETGKNYSDKIRSEKNDAYDVVLSLPSSPIDVVTSFNLKYNKNAYTYFDHIKFDMSEEEKESAKEYIKLVFVQSNIKCLEKFKIEDVTNMKKTKEQITAIIHESYHPVYNDKLMVKLLQFREELAKKYDERPDSLINLYSVISILLNTPTSIFELKKNIFPLSTILEENLEKIIQLIIQHNMKKKTKLFFLKKLLQNNEKSDNELYDNRMMYSDVNARGGTPRDDISCCKSGVVSVGTSQSSNNYVDSFNFHNMYFQITSKESFHDPCFIHKLCTVDKGLDGGGLDGSGMDGSGLDGSGLDGSGLDRSCLGGNGLDGTDLDGTDLDGNGLDGNGLDGNGLCDDILYKMKLREGHME